MVSGTPCSRRYGRREAKRWVPYSLFRLGAQLGMARRARDALYANRVGGPRARLPTCSRMFSRSATIYPKFLR